MGARNSRSATKLSILSPIRTTPLKNRMCHSTAYRSAKLSHPPVPVFPARHFPLCVVLYDRTVNGANPTSALGTNLERSSLHGNCGRTHFLRAPKNPTTDAHRRINNLPVVNTR